MNTTETTHRGGSKPVAQAILGSGSGFAPAENSASAGPASAPHTGLRPSGYGLPCAKCRTYYAADLAACPVCQSPERVSPEPRISPCAELSADEGGVDPATLEQERERFLQEFNAQLSSQQMQINASESYRCVRAENHPGGFEAASICQGCYDHVQARVDLLEAALHIDVKEAAQLVYDAVWADPSDPSKTYQHAAQALLNELHKRAGISAVLGPLQRRPH
jgi:hypothetical protein